MARYYDLDKLSEMIEARAEQLIDGKEAFLYFAKWLNILPTADVAPKSEFARVIVADMREMIKGYENIDVYLDRIEKKYTEEKQ